MVNLFLSIEAFSANLAQAKALAILSPGASKTLSSRYSARQKEHNLKLGLSRRG